MNPTPQQPIHYTIIKIALLYITLAIILGAFSAHILKTHGVMPENIASFETGIRYQLFNGLGLLLLIALRDFFKFSIILPAFLIIFGTLSFCIAVYLLTTQVMHNIQLGSAFNQLAPIGGAMMIGGWLYTFIRLLIQKNA